jgi:peptide chain release factor 2
LNCKVDWKNLKVPSIICGGGFDLDVKTEKLASLELAAAAPDFWDDQEKAQAVMRTITRLRNEVGVWEKIRKHLDDTMELTLLADDSLAEELDAEVALLEEEIAELEFRTLFSGPYDDEDAIVTIHAGAGGTEAQDWADMLLRMYTRWAESHGYTVDILDISTGDEAGIKSVMLSIRGDYVYGHLRSERGVHRLVRISPYDASKRRHTSFAKLELWPDIADEIEVEIDDKDLRIDRFRASGAGGQHVQKNETAVRITHLPTGIVVSCQNQRSLTQNMQMAMKVLKSQLYELEQEKQDEQISALKGESVDAGWGNQIRSYVLHPYKMVKDLRTNHETGNTQAVLDGRLDPFMEEYLRATVGQKSAAG